MIFTSEIIAGLEKRYRTALINSLSGFKSANLVGTCDAEKNTNLALVSSVVHIGANPPLLGMIMRPNTVPRDSLENILATQFYTLNAVHEGIYKQAHQTSARYDRKVSEFEAVGLTPLWHSSFFAPFVKESSIQIGLQLRENHELAINHTILIIGEIIEAHIPDNLLTKSGYVAIEQAETVTISSLEAYHSTNTLSHLPYAKPFQTNKSSHRSDKADPNKT